MSRITGDADAGVSGTLLGLRLVEHIAKGGRPAGVTEIATALKSTKSRVFRHLKTLVDHQFLIQDVMTELYGIGPRSVALAFVLDDSPGLAEIALPILRALRDNLGHTAVLSLVEPAGVRVAATILGRSIIEIGVRKGSLLVPHATAQGKVALAFGDPAMREAVLSADLLPSTPLTITNPDCLAGELVRIREQGWATAPNEVMIGLNTLGAPVFDRSGALRATLGVVDSVQSIPAVPTEQQIRATLNAAAALSAKLGYVADARGRQGGASMTTKSTEPSPREPQRLKSPFSRAKSARR